MNLTQMVNIMVEKEAKSFETKFLLEKLLILFDACNLLI